MKIPGLQWSSRGAAALACLLSVLLLPVFLAAQQPLHPAEGQTRLLEVRRRQIELSAARLKLQQTERLFHDGLVSNTELNQAKTSVDIAQLNYQVAMLSLLSLQPRVTVIGATKYASNDGRKFVRLTVNNNSPAFDDSQFKLLSNFEGADPIPEALRTRNLHDVFISLRNVGDKGLATDEAGHRGVTIAIPYEQRIAELPYGAAKTLVFQLLSDVESVTLAISYMGQEENIDLQLEQATTENPLTITATQISQEADLGAQASYELRLNRPTVDTRSFELTVLNLPHQISYNFVDPKTGARLSELSFPAGVTQQTVNVRLFLPEEPSGEVHIDEPIQFWALAMTPGSGARFRNGGAQTREEILASRSGAAELTVTPRGVGRIEVMAPSLFAEVSAGDEAKAELIVRNRGSRRLDTVRFSTEGPLGWRAEVTPANLTALDPNREQRVTLTVRPPANVAAGDYEVRIKTESFAYNRPVPSDDKTFRVTVKPHVNFVSLGLIVVFLLAIIIGVIAIGIRLARR